MSARPAWGAASGASTARRRPQSARKQVLEAQAGRQQARRRDAAEPLASQETLRLPRSARAQAAPPAESQHAQGVRAPSGVVWDAARGVFVDPRAHTHAEVQSFDELPGIVDDDERHVQPFGDAAAFGAMDGEEEDDELSVRSVRSNRSVRSVRSDGGRRGLEASADDDAASVTSDRSGASTGVSLAARFIALRAEQASLTKAHRECRGRCEALERALKEARAEGEDERRALKARAADALRKLTRERAERQAVVTQIGAIAAKGTLSQRDVAMVQQLLAGAVGEGGPAEPAGPWARSAGAGGATPPAWMTPAAVASYNASNNLVARRLREVEDERDEAVGVCEEAHTRLGELRTALEEARAEGAASAAEADAADERTRAAEAARVEAEAVLGAERERALVVQQSAEEAIQVRETLEAERARALDRVARRERKIDGLLKRLAEADARTIAAESAQVHAEGRLTDLEDRMAVLRARNASLGKELKSSRDACEHQRKEVALKEAECQIMADIIEQLNAEPEQ